MDVLIWQISNLAVGVTVQIRFEARERVRGKLSHRDVSNIWRWHRT